MNSLKLALDYCRTHKNKNHLTVCFSFFLSSNQKDKEVVINYYVYKFQKGERMKRLILLVSLLMLVLTAYGCKASRNTGDVNYYKSIRDYNAPRDEKSELCGRYITVSDEIARIHHKNQAHDKMNEIISILKGHSIKIDNFIPLDESITADILRKELPLLEQRFKQVQYKYRTYFIPNTPSNDTIEKIREIEKYKMELRNTLELPEYVINSGNASIKRDERNAKLNEILSIAYDFKYLDELEKYLNNISEAKNIKKRNKEVKLKIKNIEDQLKKTISNNNIHKIVVKFLRKFDDSKINESMTSTQILRKIEAYSAKNLKGLIRPFAIELLNNEINKIREIENELKLLAEPLIALSSTYQDLKKSTLELLQLNSNHHIKKHDFITILLKTLHVAYLECLGDAELLVCGSVVTGASKEDGKYPIFFESDFYPGFTINEKDIIFYGPEQWDGEFMKLSFHISEIDKMGNESIIAGFQAASGAVSAFNPEYAAVSPIVTGLFGSVVRLNQDDRELEIGFIVPQEHDKKYPETDFLVNETGDFVVMKRENPTRKSRLKFLKSDVSEDQRELASKDLFSYVYLKREDGKLYWNKKASEYSIEKDTPFTAQTYIVFNITTEYSRQDSLGQVVRNQVSAAYGEEMAKSQFPDVQEVVQMIPAVADLKHTKDISPEQFGQFQAQLKDASDTKAALIISRLRDQLDKNTRALLGTDRNAWMNAYVGGEAGNLMVVPKPLIKITVKDSSKEVKITETIDLNNDNGKENIVVDGVSNMGILWRIRGSHFATGDLESGNHSGNAATSGVVDSQGQYKAPDNIVWKDKNKVVIEAVSAVDSFSTVFVVVELYSDVSDLVVTKKPNSALGPGDTFSIDAKVKNKDGGEDNEVVWSIDGHDFAEKGKPSGSSKIGYININGEYNAPQEIDKKLTITIYAYSKKDRRVKKPVGINLVPQPLADPVTTTDTKSNALWDITKIKPHAWMKNNSSERGYSPKHKIEISAIGVDSKGYIYMACEKYPNILQFKTADTGEPSLLRYDKPEAIEIEAMAIHKNKESEKETMYLCDEKNLNIYPFDIGSNAVVKEGTISLKGLGVDISNTKNPSDTKDNDSIEGLVVSETFYGIKEEGVDYKGLWFYLLDERDKDIDKKYYAKIYITKLKSNGTELEKYKVPVKFMLDDGGNERLTDLFEFKDGLYAIISQKGKRYEIVKCNIQKSIAEPVSPSFTDYVLKLDKIYSTNFEGATVKGDGTLFIVSDNALSDEKDGDNPLLINKEKGDRVTAFLEIPSNKID